ncbi:hypothetical protein GCM10023232_16100 [Sphingosinicella ginsenosidimutans]|nr:hypothetical protein [Sphingosinicella ginsenosidimutans]
MPDEPKHIGTSDARAGSTPHVTRHVLTWGTALVVVLFIIIYFVFR